MIVAYGNQVVMEETLSKALERIFGRQEAGPGTASGDGTAVTPISAGTSGTSGTSGTTGGAGPRGGPVGSRDSLVAEANRIFNEAQAAIQKGDWSTYGQKMKELGETLRRLQEPRP